MKYVLKNGIKIRDIISVKKKYRIGDNHFPYNTYCNELLNKVEDGWVLFLDDDDILIDNNSISEIIKHIDNEDTLMIWKVNSPNGIKPLNSFKKKPTLNDICSNCFLFHSKYIKYAVWDDLKAADYRVVNRLSGIIKNIIWIDKVICKITRISDGSSIDKIMPGAELLKYLDNMLLKNNLFKNMYPQKNLNYIEFKLGSKCTIKNDNEYIYSLNSFFDKIYILNLQRRTDRWDTIKYLLEEHNINNYIQWFAVDGKTKIIENYYNEYLKKPWNNYDYKYNRKAIPSSGSFAILLSMMELLKHAVENNFKNILVLQDDIIFIKDFYKKFNEKKKEIPLDWKLIYFGASQHNWGNINTGNSFYYPIGTTDGAFAVGYNSNIFNDLIERIKKLNCPFDSGPLCYIQEKYRNQSIVFRENLIIANLENSDCRNGRDQKKYAEIFKWNIKNYIKNNLKALDKKIYYKKKINTPLVSIIVTTFNSSKYLEYSIDSLINQSYSNIEIIIIDDNSSDDSKNIIKSLASIDERIKFYFNSKNYGTYISKNIGMLISKGDFITFHDSDDYSLTNRIQNQTRFLNNNLNYDACTCNFISRSKKRNFKTAEITLFFRRNLIEINGFFDSVRVGADSEFRLRLSKNNLKIYNIKKYLYSCLDRLMEGNQTSKSNSLTSSDIFGINSEMRKCYITSYNSFHTYSNRRLFIDFPQKERFFPINFENKEFLDYFCQNLNKKDMDNVLELKKKFT